MVRVGDSSGVGVFWNVSFLLAVHHGVQVSHCFSAGRPHYSNVVPSSAFLSGKCFVTPTRFTGGGTRKKPRWLLHMAVDDDEDDDEDDEEDDDDDDIDPNSLGDWRAFRMSLAETGILTPEEQKQQKQQQQQDGSNNPTNNSNNGSTPRRSVSKRNEALLMSQNEELAKEYQKGVWAHKVATPEVGGLVCRLPLEVEIYRSQQTIGKVLRNSLGLDEDDDDTNNAAGEDGIRKGGRPSSSAFYDDDWIEEGSSAAPAGKDTNNKIPQEEEMVDDPSLLSRQNNGVSPNSAKTVLWYRGASALVKEELTKITDSAENGQIDATQLQPQSQELLQLYLDNQETWQEVGLVLDRDEVAGTATTVAINRPMALKLTENLARMVLFGAFEQEKVKDTKLFVKMLVAFDSECAIYVGGPDQQDEPSLLVHGIRDLEGAVEISPGSNIYQGGLEAAVQGIIAGKYKPLDFRFFVGRHRFFNHELDKHVALSKYQPIACARTVALKQCIALPKPLWHEVLELCGGELKELSSLELMKRDDLQVEDE